MLTQFLAVLVYDNNAGLGTCIFVDDSPEEVAIQAIDDMYQYVTDGEGKLKYLDDKLDVIDEYFVHDTDDRIQFNVFNLRTLEEVPFSIDERIRNKSYLDKPVKDIGDWIREEEESKL